jgi:hypothetical protein
LVQSHYGPKARPFLPQLARFRDSPGADAAWAAYAIGMIERSAAPPEPEPDF